MIQKFLCLSALNLSSYTTLKGENGFKFHGRQYFIVNMHWKLNTVSLVSVKKKTDRNSFLLTDDVIWYFVRYKCRKLNSVWIFDIEKCDREILSGYWLCISFIL